METTVGKAEAKREAAEMRKEGFPHAIAFFDSRMGIWRVKTGPYDPGAEKEERHETPERFGVLEALTEEEIDRQYKEARIAEMQRVAKEKPKWQAVHIPGTPERVTIPFPVSSPAEKFLQERAQQRYSRAKRREPLITREQEKTQTAIASLQDKERSLSQEIRKIETALPKAQYQMEKDDLLRELNEKIAEHNVVQGDIRDKEHGLENLGKRLTGVQKVIAAGGALGPKERVAAIAAVAATRVPLAIGRTARDEFLRGEALKRQAEYGMPAARVKAGMKRAIPRVAPPSEVPRIGRIGPARIAGVDEARIATDIGRPRIAMAPGEPRIAEGIGVSPEVRFRLNGKLDLRRRRKEEEEELRE